jgi:hypothetical protein
VTLPAAISESAGLTLRLHSGQEAGPTRRSGRNKRAAAKKSEEGKLAQVRQRPFNPNAIGISEQASGRESGHTCPLRRVLQSAGGLTGRALGWVEAPHMRERLQAYSSWARGLPSGPTWTSDFLPAVRTLAS